MVDSPLPRAASAEAPAGLEGVTEADLRWAYQALGRETEPGAGESPSEGAWGLYTRASSDTRVYQWLLEKLSPKGEKGGDDAVGADEIERLTGLAGEMRREFGELADVVSRGICPHCGKSLAGHGAGA